jgi:hypothetical protein
MSLTVELKINFFFRSNTIALVVENEEYSLSSLSSDLGGVLGLWLGLAVASLVEMIEMLCLLGYISVKKIFGFVTDVEIEEMVRLI